MYQKDDILSGGEHVILIFSIVYVPNFLFWFCITFTNQYRHTHLFETINVNVHSIGPGLYQRVIKYLVDDR